MRHPLVRRLLAAPLALWVAGVLAVPGLDGCTMHGLRAPQPVVTATAASEQALSSHAAHDHRATSSHSETPAPASPHGCLCPGDCAAGGDVAMAPTAVELGVDVVVVSAPPQHLLVRLLPAASADVRQPPSIGPPLV